MIKTLRLQTREVNESLPALDIKVKLEQDTPYIFSSVSSSTLKNKAAIKTALVRFLIERGYNYDDITEVRK